MNSAFRRIRDEVEKLRPSILEINQKIFDNPELNFNEVFSSDLLVNELTKAGFSVTRGKGKLKTAFDAAWRGSSGKPVIALIAEYDALPEIGHACGHNMISAATFGAALAVKNILGKKGGTLKVIGTPAEEGGGGKLLMIKDGWFKGVDAAMMAHPSNKTRAIAKMYAIMQADIEFYGKASHAAAFPEKGVNALDAVIGLFNNVAAMRQQCPPFTRIHGIITHGGDAANIIPEFASANFMVRGLSIPDFETMQEKLFQSARGAAKAAGCRVKIKKDPIVYLPFEPNRTMGKLFSKNLALAGLEEDKIPETDEIGSSDIGNLSHVVPSLHPEFSVGDGKAVNHSREFLKAVVSEKGINNMMKTVCALAGTAMELLTDKKLTKEVKEEFKRLGSLK